MVTGLFRPGRDIQNVAYLTARLRSWGRPLSTNILSLSG